MGWDINGKAKRLEDHFTVFSGNCEVLDLSNPEYLDSGLLKLTNSFEILFRVYVADPDMGLYHTIDADSFESTELQGLFFEIELEEIHRLESSNDCMLYGRDQTYESYAACVENELGKVFVPILGCQVPWLAQGPNQLNRCNDEVLLTEDKMKNYTKMVKNLRTKVDVNIQNNIPACPRPCKEVSASHTLKKSTKGKSEITLVFKSTVKVRKYVPAYTVFDLVVEVGSSLGLWIGLSALGVFDLLLEAYAHCLEKIKKLIQ